MWRRRRTWREEDEAVDIDTVEQQQERILHNERVAGAYVAVGQEREDLAKPRAHAVLPVFGYLLTAQLALLFWVRERREPISHLGRSVLQREPKLIVGARWSSYFGAHLGLI